MLLPRYMRTVCCQDTMLNVWIIGKINEKSLLSRCMMTVCCQETCWMFVDEIHEESLLSTLWCWIFIGRIHEQSLLSTLWCWIFIGRIHEQSLLSTLWCWIFIGRIHEESLLSSFIVKIQCWVFVTVCCQDTMLNLYWQDTWREFVVKLHVLLSRYSVECLLPRYMRKVCWQDTGDCLYLQVQGTRQKTSRYQ